MWQLTSEKEGKRIFTDSVTNSTCTQTMCYTDKEGNYWWVFDSLITIPYTRNFAATKISSLYALGLSRDDLTGHINGLKKILKSNDPEKYEKAFANLLDFESKAAQATDTLKQMTSLVCVYFTMNDEPVDSFVQDLQLRKMSILEADYDAHCFFLQRQAILMQVYTNTLELFSQIVSVLPSELSAALQ